MAVLDARSITTGAPSMRAFFVVSSAGDSVVTIGVSVAPGSIVANFERSTVIVRAVESLLA